MAQHAPFSSESFPKEEKEGLSELPMMTTRFQPSAGGSHLGRVRDSMGHLGHHLCGEGIPDVCCPRL